MEQYDVVIPISTKDEWLAEITLNQFKKNFKGYNRIYVVSPNKLNLDVYKNYTDNELIKKSDAIIFDVRYKFQLTLKMNIFDLIPELLDNTFIFDADNIFLKPINPFHYDYIENDREEWPSDSLIDITKPSDRSGVVHMSMFNRYYINEIKQIAYNKTGKTIEEHIDKQYRSQFSEYNLYFKYLENYKSNITFKQLKRYDKYSYDKLPREVDSKIISREKVTFEDIIGDNDVSEYDVINLHYYHISNNFYERYGQKVQVEVFGLD